MSGAQTRWLVLLLLTAVMVVMAVAASAQAPVVATDRLAVLDQYLRDVRDHRDWLEGQLAAAKSANADLQKQLTHERGKKCESP